MFGNLFKAKWQHSKAAIRLTAVDTLNPDTPEQQQILRNLALEDDSSQVRFAAQAKLRDLDLLQKVTQLDKEASNRSAARERIVQLLASANPPANADNLLKQQEPTTLQQIAREGENLDIRIQAIALIQDEAQLAKLATSATVSKIRQLACERLEQQELLEQVAKQSRGHDKRVYQSVKQRLQQRQEAQRQKQLLAERRLELCDAIERQSQADPSALLMERVEKLQRNWQELGQGNLSDELRNRFAQALSACQALINDYQQNQQQRETRPEAPVESNAKQSVAPQQLLDQLEQRLQQLKQQPLLTSSNLSDNASQIAQLSAQWQPLQSDSDAVLRQHVNSQLQQLKLYQQQAELLFQPKSGLQSQLTRTETKLQKKLSSRELRDLHQRLQQQLQQIDWPQDFTAPELLGQAEQLLDKLQQNLQHQAQEEQRRREQFQRKLEKFSTALDEGHTAQAKQLHRDLNRLLKNVNGRERDQQQALLHPLNARYTELCDWQGFATTPKKEELCQQMEALIDSDIPPQELAQQIKGLQNQWRALGQSDPQNAQQLWERFKSAADQAYEPCKAYFAEQTKQRELNLEKRQQLCDQLEQFLQQNDWHHPDWKLVEKVIQVAKQEWRQFRQVQRSQGKKLQQQFDELINKLQEKLDNERSRNIRLKQRVVEEAEQLIELEDLQQAISDAKALQQRWQEIGITFYKQDRELWKAFRSACDAIFARKEERRQAFRQELEEHRHSASDLIEQIQRLSSKQVPAEAGLPQLHQVQQRFAELGQLPRAAEADLNRQFERAVSDYEALCAKQQRQQQRQQLEQLKQRAALCQQLEQLSVEATQNPSLIEELQQNWASLPAPETEADRALANQLQQRFDNALKVLDESNGTELIALNHEQLEAWRELAIRMEILAGIDSPPEERELRMQYQVERLSQGLTHASEEALSVEQQSEHLEREWLRLAPAVGATYQGLEARFHQALQQLNLG